MAPSIPLNNGVSSADEKVVPNEPVATSSQPAMPTALTRQQHDFDGLVGPWRQHASLCESCCVDKLVESSRGHTSQTRSEPFAQNKFKQILRVPPGTWTGQLKFETLDGRQLVIKDGQLCISDSGEEAIFHVLDADMEKKNDADPQMPQLYADHPGFMSPCSESEYVKNDPAWTFLNPSRASMQALIEASDLGTNQPHGMSFQTIPRISLRRSLLKTSLKVFRSGALKTRWRVLEPVRLKVKFVNKHTSDHIVKQENRQEIQENRQERQEEQGKQQEEEEVVEQAEDYGEGLFD
ncbi:hypothetical protein CERZMDRAFT_98723 [Cercospora zeae-maydis SCOH1-5]|uniref:Uncharacterized protein n=1 Tax=Cercospora zeae-maydis SCOH1-5 TaxID=717836 RepID=A0A6A6FBX6_9PEZI|nr:hypothetical protein CERZMDRAFT_98723 [Cercospora zeae-maydis SCOH1-5]